jgi:hypothetical protein
MSEEKKSTPVPFAYPVTAWAQKRAHPTFIDSKDNFLKNKFTLLLHHAYLHHAYLDNLTRKWQPFPIEILRE